MQSFIQEVAQHILSKYPDQLEHLQVIFPNRRAGLYLREEISRIIQEPIWMPKISSLEDFIGGFSPYRKLDTLEAILMLYDQYKELQSGAEVLDQFFFWGEMILRDFEEIAQYEIDPQQLFTSIESQKELDEAFYFLDADDKKIIQNFWKTFLPQASSTQHQFLQTWKVLNPLHESFKETLLERGLGYEGIIYGSFLKELESGSLTVAGPLVFAGFNALTVLEEKVLKSFVRAGKTEILWDLDHYYMSDRFQEAGVFLRRYAQDSILRKTFPAEWPSRLQEKKEIQVTGVSLEVGQAKAMAEHLEIVSKKEGFVPERTVIVLPNEYMLFPVLHAIPATIDRLNVTMGYALKDTPVFSLLESILKMQASRRSSVVHGYSYYNQPVMDILQHPLIAPLGAAKTSDFVTEVKKRNLIFIYQEDLPKENETLDLIFSEPHTPLPYLLQILVSLHRSWKAKGHDIELEFISRFYQHIKQLDEVLGDKASALSYDFLIRLFRRLTKSLKIPFSGEPLDGLQVMGILETRNLDFENVFILNMNENNWPAPPKKGSFIPYNIRKAFDLPVNEHQDAIYAYLFYRILQRAQRVWIYYNIVSEFNVNGELSRFVQQLQFESSHEVKHQVLANPVTLRPTKAIVVEKSPRVQEKLKRFLVDPGEWSPRLTPSALDTYLYCRLRFYFKYCEEFYEPDKLQEELDPMVFGNILHDTMEILYGSLIKREKKQIVDYNDFFGLDAAVDGAVNKAFIQHYQLKDKKKFKLEGRNVIAAEIIKKTARRILKIDQSYAPFRILGLEASTRDGYTLDFPLELNGSKLMVGLKGKIDRIDLKQGRIRVIDYKTGKDSREFISMDDLIERESESRNKAAFQVFFYSYLFLKTNQEDFKTIEPALYNSRDLFTPDFDWRIFHKEGRDQFPVDNFLPHTEAFQEILSQLLTEIFDPEIPFDQVEDDRKCKWCPYNGICDRA